MRGFEHSVLVNQLSNEQVKSAKSMLLGKFVALIAPG
jgi:hypothetical protein